MADTSPYADDLDGSRVPRPDDGPESLRDPQHPFKPENAPELLEHPADDRMDAAPAEAAAPGISHADDDIPPTPDEAADVPAAPDSEHYDVDPGAGPDPVASVSGTDAIDMDAEPNDSDSQVLPPDEEDAFDADDTRDDEDYDEPRFSDEPNDSDAAVTAEDITGSISFVGVPIGNYGDITQRALRTLQMADLVVCEDYKATARLLRSFNITKKLVEMTERNEEQASEQVLESLRRGKSVAVVAVAGLPMIADPGSILATKLRRMGVEPNIIPGVSSVMTGLMASGFNLENFDFVGVIPRRPEDRLRVLEDLAGRDRTIVMLEAPFRLRSLLAALAEAMPGRQAAIAANLTTPFESVVRGTLADLSARFAQKRFKGDLVLVLDRLKPTELGAAMSASMPEFDEEPDAPEMEEEFGAEDAGSRPFRRTPHTPSFRGEDEARGHHAPRPPRHPRPHERPHPRDRRDDRRERDDRWNRGGREERRDDERRDWPRGGERRGGDWNRDRRPGGSGDWNRNDGGNRDRRPGGGGWNRNDGGNRDRKPGGGGWNRDDGGNRDRRPGGGGWSRDDGGNRDRRPGGKDRGGPRNTGRRGGWSR